MENGAVRARVKAGVVRRFSSQLRGKIRVAMRCRKMDR